MLDVRNLSVAYGQSQVLHGINFAVAPGEIVAVVGRNGMGKSTLMKSLIGVMPARSGQVLVDGGDVSTLPSHTRVAQRPRLRAAGPPDLRHHDGAREHRDRPRRHRQEPRSRRRSTRCSRCCKSSTAAAAATSPAASSSSSRSRARWRAIRRSCCSTSRPRASSLRSSRRSRGCSRRSATLRNLCIVVCEQVLSFVLEIADRILVMEDGRIVHSDTREHVDEAAIARFLAV